MFKKIAVTAGLALATVAATLGITASSASASPYAFGIVVTGVQSHLAMEVRGWSTTPGMTIDQARSNADSPSHSYYGTSQQWSMPTLNDGWDGATGVIWNMYSNQCIETDGHAGDAVYQWTCNGSVYQQWHITTFSVWDWDLWLYVTHAHIVNPASGLALDVRGGSMSPGAAIVGWPLNGNNSDNQAWDLNRA